MKSRTLSCWMTSPRDCFSCPYDDCVCTDQSLPVEGKWMRAGVPTRKTNRAEAPKPFTIHYDTIPRTVKSNAARNNYEYLFF